MLFTLPEFTGSSYEDFRTYIDANLRRKTGKINSVIFGKRNFNRIFKDSSFLLALKTKTSFLMTEDVMEMLYAVINDIYEYPINRSNGKRLKFRGFTYGYSGIAYNRIKDNIKIIEDAYTNSKYVLKDKEYIKELCIDMLKNRKVIPKTSFNKNIDILCSIIHYTSYKDFNNSNDLCQHERIYLLANGYDSVPDKYSKFSDRGFSYSEPTDVWMPNKMARCRKKTFNRIKNNVEKTGEYGVLNVVDDFVNVNESVFKIKRNCDGKEFEYLLHNGYSTKMDLVEKWATGSSGSSVPQAEIEEFLSENKISFEKNIRNVIPPREIDIYISGNKIGIELDGLFYHSRYDSKYHVNKTVECEKLGIQLLHILDCEWNYKRDICKSLIMSKLGIFTNKLYARKCKILKLDNKIAKEFVENNHLGGSANHSIAYGLEYQGEIVSVMTFGRRNITGARKVSWELIRFCNKLNTCVVGSASKLLKRFENDIKPLKIITYADRRISNGNLYKIIGFDLLRISRPNYWYTKDYCSLKHRAKYMKHKLSKIIDNFDPMLTEWENMQNNGFRRYWDCGNYVFEKEYAYNV